MALITSSNNLLYLMKTSWCDWIILIKENFIVIRSFCFNIQLIDCLQVQEKYPILLFAQKILRNSAPILPENILLGILEQ